MARTKIHKDKSAISLAKQMVALRKQYETEKVALHRDRLVWEGVIQPTILSGQYTIRIIYKKGGVPIVFIKDPELIFPNGKRPPHLYKGNNLCLHYPPNEDWTKRKLIAKTIVPWTSLWLYCYEIWLVTGKWRGGGFHPVKK